jgi:tRNA(fMet)-specific endonuclease VapC
MSYLLDTNIVIYHLSSVEAASTLVDELFDAGVAISVVSYVEVLEGISRGSDPESAQARFRALIDRIPVIDFTRREADELVKVRQSLRQHGRQVRRRALDLQIAATALAHDLTLVTNDPDDYDHISDLKLHRAQIVP